MNWTTPAPHLEPHSDPMRWTVEQINELRERVAKLEAGLAQSEQGSTMHQTGWFPIDEVEGKPA